MTQQSAPPEHATFVLERDFPQPVPLVFALLSRPELKRRWLLEDEGTTVDSYDMDFRVGGKELGRYSFRKGSPVDGMPFVNEGTFLDIVPDRRVVSASAMSIAGRTISIALVTFDLVPAGDGSVLTLIHQGIFYEGSGGAQMREGGWKVLMDRLAGAAAAAGERELGG